MSRHFLAALTEATAAHAEQLRRTVAIVRSAAGGGSGTAWAPGIVVTNSHVVGGDEASVIDAAGVEHRARLVARNRAHDLAVLRVPVAAAFDPVRAGESRTLRAGELVSALGNPWGAPRVLTTGAVLLAPAATADGLVRANVRLAPGNSGGPLFDAVGRVVGINAAIVGGLAVAIPVETVQAFLAEALPATRF